jgi:cell division protein FtsB
MKHGQAGTPARLKWIVIGFAALAALIAVDFFRELARSRQIDREIASLKEEAERLRARNFEIRSLQAAAQKDEYFEREARLKLNLRKEGERVIILQRRDADLSSEALAKGEAGGEGGWSNPRRWWTYFADRKSYDQYAAELRDD